MGAVCHDVCVCVCVCVCFMRVIGYIYILFTCVLVYVLSMCLVVACPVHVPVGATRAAARWQAVHMSHDPCLCGARAALSHSTRIWWRDVVSGGAGVCGGCRGAGVEPFAATGRGALPVARHADN